jgi:hypothetical protein
MSLNLKHLMEEDAGRPVSPAPVDDVLAGGRSRVRRRRIVAVAAAAVAAVLAIAIPVALLPGDSTDEPIERLERTEWSQLDGPWVDLRSIHVGDLTVPRPPGWNVDVLTSTQDSAVYWSSKRGGRVGVLTEVRTDGSVHRLGSDVLGPPFTDPTGSYVAWRSTHEIVVYDTSTGSEVSRQPVGDDSAVNAVDDGVVTYTDAERLYAWQPDQGEPVEIDLPDTGFVSDVAGELRIVGSLSGRGEAYVVDGDGERVLTLEQPGYGEFDPSGRYIAVSYHYRADGREQAEFAVRAVDSESDTRLSGYDGDIYQISWDPSGVLILGTVAHFDGIVNPDDELTFYACDPETGACGLIEGSTTTVAAAPMPANFATLLLWSYSG